jgi:hypothetical protein
MPKPNQGAENAEIGCRIGAKSGADVPRNHLPISTEIRCRFAPIFAIAAPLVIDLRNIYRADEMAAAGLSYVSIGRKPRLLRPGLRALA